MIYGIEYMRRLLVAKRSIVLQKYKYYDMKYVVRDLGISTPPQLRYFNHVLGWNSTAVDALADRLVFRGFRNDDVLNIGEIFRMNNMHELTDASILGALISACNFIYISEDELGYPRLQAIDGGNATGIKDPISGLLSEGYAVLERDQYGKEITVAYFLPGETHIIDARTNEEVEVYTNPAPYPLLVPIINRPDAVSPFGHSVISRACIDYTNAAARSLKRGEISSEFYSFPQRYAVGTDPAAEQLDTWRAAMSAMLQYDRDEEGNSPTLGQFQQQSMTPFSEEMTKWARLYAGETGLTLDDLGFADATPTSSEVIKASHVNLVRKARKAQRTFGDNFVNVGYLAACVRDDAAYERNNFYNEIPLWEPIFELDAAQLGAMGDAIIKISQAFPDYFTEDKLRDLTGI